MSSVRHGATHSASLVLKKVPMGHCSCLSQCCKGKDIKDRPPAADGGPIITRAREQDKESRMQCLT